MTSQMIRSLAATAAVVAALLTSAPAVMAQTANGSGSGTFTAGTGKPIKLRYAYAQLQESDDAPAKQEILLLLSDVPLDDETRDDWIEQVEPRPVPPATRSPPCWPRGGVS